MDAPDPTNAVRDDEVTYMELPGDRANSASNLMGRAPAYADADATTGYQELPVNSPASPDKGHYQDIHPNTGPVRAATGPCLHTAGWHLKKEPLCVCDVCDVFV